MPNPDQEWEKDLRWARRMSFKMSSLGLAVGSLGLALEGFLRTPEWGPIRSMTFLVGASVFSMVLCRPSTWKEPKK